MDGGGALAAIFAHMFSQTVDRYNRVLHKDYIEFLNLLSVRQKPVTPATGYVAVEIAPGTEEAVEIPRDTALFHDGEDGERVNYRTDETIFATPARIVGMVTVDPAQDAVAVREAGQEALDLFFVPEEHNRQRHADHPRAGGRQRVLPGPADRRAPERPRVRRLGIPRAGAVARL